ncbi:uncharacterized protein LOC129581279 [Paramacrobiotus metropolitanus]|uniref:uncharacterized protein LOC129581279 n=1 Tax=Paramacrobiotus metropolitanus TaxID=2943436 RepID=UPI0024461C60|nr:uncharacterized protein LOC129581279 [Paramacrobiotus metropolitanus]
MDSIVATYLVASALGLLTCCISIALTLMMYRQIANVPGQERLNITDPKFHRIALLGMVFGVSVVLTSLLVVKIPWTSRGPPSVLPAPVSTTTPLWENESANNTVVQCWKDYCATSPYDCLDYEKYLVNCLIPIVSTDRLPSSHHEMYAIEGESVQLRCQPLEDDVRGVRLGAGYYRGRGLSTYFWSRNAHHLAQQHLQDGHQWTVAIDHSVAVERLSAAGDLWIRAIKTDDAGVYDCVHIDKCPQHSEKDPVGCNLRVGPAYRVTVLSKGTVRKLYRFS